MIIAILFKFRAVRSLDVALKKTWVICQINNIAQSNNRERRGSTYTHFVVLNYFKPVQTGNKVGFSYCGHTRKHSEPAMRLYLSNFLSFWMYLYQSVILVYRLCGLSFIHFKVISLLIGHRSFWLYNFNILSFVLVFIRLKRLNVMADPFVRVFRSAVVRHRSKHPRLFCFRSLLSQTLDRRSRRRFLIHHLLVTQQNKIRQFIIVNMRLVFIRRAFWRNLCCTVLSVPCRSRFRGTAAEARRK